MSDESKEVELKSFSTLEEANILRSSIMENVPRVWVLVKLPHSDSQFKVCVMDVWGTSPTQEQLDECKKYIN